MGVIRYVGLAALFITVYLLILRPIKKHVLAALVLEQPSLPAAGIGQRALSDTATLARDLISKAEEDNTEPVLQDDLDGINAQVRKTVTLKKQLVEKIKSNPEAASRLVQNWIRKSEVRA